VGYNFAALQFLAHQLSLLPRNGGVLELGAQDINAGVPLADVFACARAAHPDDAPAAQAAAARYDSAKALPVSALFIGSPFRYRCLDLMPRPATIVADLNEFRVPPQDCLSFDLITNVGTSEHVADQINAFRVMHDYARVGALIVHQVPFAGYFNHGLINYHPAFFVFLAAANDYVIEYFGLSPPHVPYTIPEIDGLDGCSFWIDRVVECGMIICHLRKVKSERFRLFTDYDRTALAGQRIPPPWNKMIDDRYDLRIRSKSG